MKTKRNRAFTLIELLFAVALVAVLAGIGLPLLAGVRAEDLGSPLSLDYPSLTGQINISIAAGQFLKAEPGVGRLLSVLSLQALPRRLVLDFRDVFQQGFAFDDISGDVQMIHTTDWASIDQMETAAKDGKVQVVLDPTDAASIDVRIAWRFAEGATTGPPNAAKTSRASGCAGTRKATVSRPARATSTCRNRASGRTACCLGRSRAADRPASRWFIPIAASNATLVQAPLRMTSRPFSD